MANSQKLNNQALKDLQQYQKNSGYESFHSQLIHSFGHSDIIREEAVDSFQEAWLYYRRLRPNLLTANEDASSVSSGTGASHGRSYVEPVLSETVDSIMPSLLNIFAENDVEAVKYRPTSKFVPTEVAVAVNKTINEIFLRKNNGYKELYDAFLEGLITGDCYMKVYISEDVIEEEIEVEDASPIQLLEAILEEYPDTDTDQFKITKKTNKDTGQKEELFTTEGMAILTRIERNPKIDYIPWGEVYVDALTTEISEARYICHRTMSYVGLVQGDFPEQEDIIDSASTIQALGEADTSNLKLETLQQHINKDSDYTYSLDPNERPIYLYEHFIYSSFLDKKGKTKLYQVFATDADILSITEVESMPLLHGKAISLPDSYWGISLHSLCKHEQDKLSELTRIISDNGSNATRGRYLAAKGQYDRRALLDNRPGGVVEVTAPGAIDLFPYHNLDPAIDNLYAKIKESTEQNKGNAIGLGLEQNLNNVAASTVAMAVQNAEMSDKRIAKQFAYSLIRPLFEKLYNLIRDEDLPLETENPEDTPITGRQLPKRCDFHIDVNTSNDAAREAGQLMSVLQTEMTLSGGQSQIMSEQERYNIYEAALAATGIIGADQYVKNPKDYQATPEEIEKQETLELAGQRAQEIGIKTSEAELHKLIADTGKVQADIERDKESTLLKNRELDLKDKELEIERARGMADVALTQTRDQNAAISD